MKKILTVSLFAMMAVSAANADIASTNYVDTAKTAAISTAASDATTKANQAKADAISAAASDATSKANAAKEAAIAAIPAVDSTFNGDSNNAATSKAIATYVSSRLEVLNGDQAAINASIGELKADIAAINNESTGILAQAEADAKSKADAAQSAAESKVTALQNGAVKTNTDNIAAMDTAYKLADTNIKNTIGTVPADKTVVGMIAEAQTAATYDDTAVRGLISDNADEINTIKSSAYATSGITKAKVDAYDGYDAKITAAKKAGDDAQADVDALKTTVSDMDTAYKLADTNIKNTIGDVASGKTVVGMIADAKSGAVTEAANDAETKYQGKSSAAYTIGTTGGGWTDLKSLTGYSKTGTFSLVLKNDVLQWEAVNY